MGGWSSTSVQAKLIFRCQNLSDPSMPWDTEAGKWNRLTRKRHTLRRTCIFISTGKSGHRAGTPDFLMHTKFHRRAKFHPRHRRGSQLHPNINLLRLSSLILQTHMPLTPDVWGVAAIPGREPTH